MAKTALQLICLTTLSKVSVWLIPLRFSYLLTTHLALYLMIFSAWSAFQLVNPLSSMELHRRGCMYCFLEMIRVPPSLLRLSSPT